MNARPLFGFSSGKRGLKELNWEYSWIRYFHQSAMILTHLHLDDYYEKRGWDPDKGTADDA